MRSQIGLSYDVIILANIGFHLILMLGCAIKDLIRYIRKRCFMKRIAKKEDVKPTVAAKTKPTARQAPPSQLLMPGNLEAIQEESEQ